MRVLPAPADAGVRFRRTDSGHPAVPALAGNVCATRLGTSIGDAEESRVATVEHLMAAFNALGIDNALVEIDGPEAPILDGSSQPFVQGLDRAGRSLLRKARRFLEIVEPVEVVDDRRRAALLPSCEFEVAVEIDFANPVIGRQSIDLVLSEAAFRRELADCRTFGFAHEVEALRAAGLARGGSLANAIVVDADKVLNPEGLRRPDEFVRHKALDAVGDLYLAGGPLLGRYEARCAGHAMNNALLRALFARPAAWRWVTREEALAEAG